MYIGNTPLYQSFVTDTFSGNGSTTAFTMSVAPANTPSVLVAVSGVLQDPSTYSVSGTTLTFSAAPPSGTSNISVRYLGIPASGVTTTAYRTVTEFTATASQTTFTPASYTPGYINVYQNGALLGSADYTATNGTTVVLAVGATAGDLVVIESFYVSSVLNAIPATSGSINSSYIASGAVTPTQLNTQAQYTGYKNRFINACMRVAQRATSATVTAGTTVPTSSTGYPCVDRWFVYSTGANVTAAQVAGSNATQNRLQITGAASVTAVGVGQRIEVSNSYDLNNQTVTLSVDMANSVLTTVTWTASYATTANTFGTIGTPTKTQIATGTFTVNSTVANYSTQITIPSAATTGIEILFTVGAQTSGTWTIGNPQLELGAVATSFDARPIGTELALCQRYFQINGGTSGFPFVQGAVNAANDTRASFPFPVSMRATPTTTIAGTWASTNINGVAAPALSALGTQGYVLQTYSTSAGGYYYYPNSADDIMTFNAEL